MTKTSLFTYVAETLRNAKETLGVGETLKVVIPMGDWKSYNEDDIALIIISAAEYSISANENLTNDFQYFEDGDISAVTITVENNQ